METTSKTLTVALNELIQKLEQSDTARISDLSKALAENLPRNYSPYLFPEKALTVSVERQKASHLYSAVYTLVDDVKPERKGA